MKYKEKIRCEYSDIGLKSLRTYHKHKQRRGYVIGEDKRNMFIVVWDGLKTGSRYAKRFIVADPLIDLVSMPKEENESKYPLDLPDGRWVYIDKTTISICGDNIKQVEYKLNDFVEKISTELLFEIIKSLPPSS